ncbi:MAG: hypothetical protein Tp152DCM46671_7 [Prokaryotic dsDNA virus sp.]|nr:MAG: hypothetical protein Tp152DCM46671_7 [Prokaryotic dsDNA virus sp.]|tara:strand:+ start:2103 stop:3374 length:1272 start_codon:yes stop_codon:yes gene_type:complete
MQTNLFELNPNLTRLIENVQLGPQAEVLELIDEFNHKYIQGPNHVNRSYYLQAPTKNLGITKKFYWKPGAYDTIKQILWYQGEMHKKAASLEKVVQRVQDNANWRLRGIKNELYNIENILINFRQQGLIMQDNTDDVIEAWNILYNHLMEQYENSNHKFTMALHEEFDNDDELCNYKLDIIYNYQDVKLSYKHVDSNEEIAEIEIPGRGYISVRFSLNKLLNSIIMAKHDLTKIKNIRNSRFSSNARNSAYTIGGNWDSYMGIEHPYISRNHNSYNHSNQHHYNFKYVCVGNLEDEFQACIQSLDFISLQLFIDRVMTHYDTNTQPLNRITQTYHGIPTCLENNEEFFNVQGATNANRCDYRSELRQLSNDGVNVEEDSYCIKYCTIKETCDTWKSVTKQLTPEEVQQKALEHATLQMVRRNQ